MNMFFEKDGITVQARDVLDAARLQKAGYKEIIPVEPKPEKPVVDERDLTPAEDNAAEVEKVNKKKGGA